MNITVALKQIVSSHHVSNYHQPWILKQLFAITMSTVRIYMISAMPSHLHPTATNNITHSTITMSIITYIHKYKQHRPTKYTTIWLNWSMQPAS